MPCCHYTSSCYSSDIDRVYEWSREYSETAVQRYIGILCWADKNKQEKYRTLNAGNFLNHIWQILA